MYSDSLHFKHTESITLTRSGRDWKVTIYDVVVSSVITSYSRIRHYDLIRDIEITKKIMVIQIVLRAILRYHYTSYWNSKGKDLETLKNECCNLVFKHYNQIIYNNSNQLDKYI